MNRLVYTACLLSLHCGGTGYIAPMESDVGAYRPPHSVRFPQQGDLFLAKLDANGDPMWLHQFGNSMALGRAEGMVAVGPEDQIVLAGELEGARDFGCGRVQTEGRDLFVARFAPSGQCLDAWRSNGDGAARVTGLSIDAAGTTVLTGRLHGTLDLGSGPVDGGLGAPFVASFRSGETSAPIRLVDEDQANTDPQPNDGGSSAPWRQQLARAQVDSVAADNGGGVVVAGRFGDTLQVGAERLTSAGEYDIFIISFDREGHVRFAKRYGDERNQTHVRLAIASDGVIVVGTFGETL
ncbi:MAG: hypothetical protein JRH11_19685 [Deltaproteobacteria bacterium]|nr:hypothetical protein [Deltaproteobacteria bacterium]